MCASLILCSQLNCGENIFFTFIFMDRLNYLRNYLRNLWLCCGRPPLYLWTLHFTPRNKSQRCLLGINTFLKKNHIKYFSVKQQNIMDWLVYFTWNQKLPRQSTYLCAKSSLFWLCGISILRINNSVAFIFPSFRQSPAYCQTTR